MKELTKRVIEDVQKPVNPHRQRLLAASLKQTKPEVKAEGDGAKKPKPKGTAKAKVKTAAKAKSKKRGQTDQDQGYKMTDKEITSYYSSTKKWFMDKLGAQKQIFISNWHIIVLEFTCVT